MNLIQFLKKTDAAVAERSADDMRALIHEIARTLPEKDRECFLDLLRPATPDESGAEKENLLASMTKEHDDILKNLDQVNKGELCLKGYWDDDSDQYDPESDSWEEDWRHYIYEEEDGYVYEDPDGVGEILDDAVEFVHKCVDCETYDLGEEVIKALSVLEVSVDDEESDTDALTLGAMADEDLLCIDYYAFVCDAVYIEYQNSGMPGRPRAVYDTISAFSIEHFTLESVLQGDYEIQDIEEFLPGWIDYLGQKGTSEVSDLLLEAIELADNPSFFLSTARKYCKNYPFLYKEYLDKNPGQDSDETLYQIGIEALDQVETFRMVRSQIALDTAARALRLGNTQGAEECWLEAFRSETSVLNYLRLRNEHHDYEKIRDEVKRIYQSYKPDDASGSRYLVYEGKEINEKTYYMLCFLEGDLEYAIEHGMNFEGNLGWSGTFMKIGLSMLLFLLTGDKKFGSGCKYMLNMVIKEFDLSVERYQQGTLLETSHTDEEFFETVFRDWKKSIVISEEDIQKYLLWTEELVDRRVQSILASKYRNYYHECAAYVAALGEAKESNGVSRGRQQEMHKYRDKYSHYSRFIEELRTFGMRNQRKSSLR